MDTAKRKASDAHRNAKKAYPFKCCVICGLQIDALDIAHLDHNPENNEANNRAYLCKTHHWMVDAGMYPLEAVKMLRAHWQVNRGKANHKARMKDAGVKSGLTRRRKSAAKKAVASRKAKQANAVTT